MKISKNLICINNEKKHKKLIYNHRINKACLIDNKLYEKINFELGTIDQNFEISIEDKHRLLKYGIIIDNDKKSETDSYAYRLDNRDKSILLNEVYLHITQKCNLACTYCYNKENLGKEDYLDFNKIIDVITKLKSVGVQKIVITGGEPLLREDIQEVCASLQEMNITVSLLTNGCLLDSKFAVLRYVNSAIVSLDTFNAENNSRKGLNINKLKETLLNIPVELKSKISIRAVISKKNENSWREVESFAKENGYQFTSSILIPTCKEEIDDIPSMDKIVLSEVILNFSGNLCGASYRIIAVDSNGDIYPCQSLVKGNFKITNILRDTWFEELSQSLIVHEFANLNVDYINKCNLCEYRYLCGGGCRAIAFNVYDSINEQVECLCTLNREIAIRKLKGLLEYYG
jgi:radical SAM protein with 4Fe4S-binding SPASM domain